MKLVGPRDSDKRKAILSSIAKKEDSASLIAEAIERSNGDRSCHSECSWPILGPLLADELKSIRKIVEGIDKKMEDKFVALDRRVSPVETKVSIGQWFVAAVVTVVGLPIVFLVYKGLIK